MVKYSRLTKKSGASKKAQKPKDAAKPVPAVTQEPPELIHGMGSEARQQTILHMQRVYGNRATQQILAKQQAQVTQRTPETIQRDFGFELETNWRIFGYSRLKNKLRSKLTNAQKTTAFMPQPAYRPKYVNDDLKKGQPIIKGNHFEMQVDELSSGGKDIEFVSTLPPFPETATGRQDLDNSLTDLDTLAGIMMNSQNFNMHPSDLGHGTVKHEAIIKKNTNGMSGSPQVTAAVRLDQIEELFETMGTPTGAQADPTKDTTRSKLANAITGGAQSKRDATIMGDAPGEARSAIQTYQGTLNNSNNDDQQNFANDVGSDKLIGLMSLIITYLKLGSLGQVNYAKQIAPMLARTNFAQMFSTLTDEEKTYFKNNAQEWVDLNLDAAGFAGAGATPVLAGGIQSNSNNNILDRITRELWLQEMTKGKDILSQPAYDKMFGKKKGGSELESLGRLGKKMENVGNNHPTTAPIFEMRRMKGSVPQTDWHQLILDAFDYVAAVNDKQQNPRM